MRHRKATFKIGRTSAHRRALLANLVSSLIECGEIRTTARKAKEASRFMDKMITYAKKGDLHRRRLAISKIRNEDAVRKLFAEIAPKFADRKGGYTRVIKIGNRVGDAAEMCILQLVSEEISSKAPKKKKGTKRAEKKQAPKQEKASSEKAEKAEKKEDKK